MNIDIIKHKFYKKQNEDLVKYIEDLEKEYKSNLEYEKSKLVDKEKKVEKIKLLVSNLKDMLGIEKEEEIKKIIFDLGLKYDFYSCDMSFNKIKTLEEIKKIENSTFDFDDDDDDDFDFGGN